MYTVYILFILFNKKNTFMTKIEDDINICDNKITIFWPTILATKYWLSSLEYVLKVLAAIS